MKTLKNKFILIIVSFLIVFCLESIEARAEDKVVLKDCVVEVYPSVSLTSGIDSRSITLKNSTLVTILDDNLENQTKIFLDDMYGYIESSNLISKEEYDKLQKSEYADILLNLSEEDYILLTKVLYLESENQDFKGQVLTLEVILNRVLHEEWPDTLKDVLYQKGQFSTIKRVAKLEEGQPYEAYLDDCVDLSDERAVIRFCLINGRTYLDSDYVYFATYKANGKSFIYYDRHYYSK